MTDIRAHIRAQMGMSHVKQAGALKDRLDARGDQMSNDAREILWSMYFMHLQTADYFSKDT